MSIRDARAQDIPALETLARDLPTAAHWTPAQYHDLFTGTPRIVWLIEEDNIVVAFLVARSSGSDWEIENLAVAEARQRCGLATELLRALIAHAAVSGATSIFLEVRVSNLPAQRFYQAHAFREAGRRPNYYFKPGRRRGCSAPRPQRLICQSVRWMPENGANKGILLVHLPDKSIRKIR
jgi:ribosomal-protein-alanine N-acetyltransferase